VQLVAPEDPEYLPAIQSVQPATPSVFVEVRTVLEYVPALQLEQDEDEAAEVFPDAQEVHVVAPVTAAYLPKAQLEHASSPVDSV